MKSKLLAATLFIAACGSKSAPSHTTPTPDQTQSASTTTATSMPAATPAVASTGKAKPAYGTYGFDTSGMDTKAKPGDSFYRYANGTWLDKTPIPADKSNYGMFSVLSDQSDERTKTIILGAKGAPGSEERKIADYYAAFMDETAIEKAGLDPLKPELDAIAKIKTSKDVTLAFAQQSRLERRMPITTGVGQDDKDPEHYIANIGQGGLGLPDRDMYDAKNKQFEPLRVGYKKWLSTALSWTGAKDADKRAAAVYALEEKLAASHWTRVQNRDPQKTYNKMTIAQLTKLAPDFDWKTWLDATGLAKETAFNVNQPSAITAAAKLVKSTPVAVWRDYLSVQVLKHEAGYLSKQYVDAWFEMFGKTLSGTPQIKDRWKRGVDEVTNAMGEAVGKLYVSKYFTPETKQHADELVHNLLTAMGQRLDGLAWMSDETKAKAKTKLSTYNPKIGYPKKWRDYSALEVSPTNVIANDEGAAAFEYNRQLAHLGQPIDRDEWGMTPMTV
ncbi:MAG: M13 family metallopeptidase, partial [Deltaproteobacteria bacterium]|nr:M13 family metallopeptidase [Deltaproteobacteria bacterium]